MAKLPGLVDAEQDEREEQQRVDHHQHDRAEGMRSFSEVSTLTR